MLQYKDLSPAQRRWVDLVSLFFPDTGSTLTYTELTKIDRFFFVNREKDPRFKISKPLWLISNNAVSRGIYFFPRDTAVYTPPDTNTDLENTLHEELRRLDVLDVFLNPRIDDDERTDHG